MQEDVLISQEDDEVFSSPFVTKKAAEQHLLESQGINIFKLARPENFYTGVLKELAEEISCTLMLMFNSTWNIMDVPENWMRMLSQYLKRASKMTQITIAQ